MLISLRQFDIAGRKPLRGKEKPLLHHFWMRGVFQQAPAAPALRHIGDREADPSFTAQASAVWAVFSF